MQLLRSANRTSLKNSLFRCNCSLITKRHILVLKKEIQFNDIEMCSKTIEHFLIELHGYTLHGGFHDFIYTKNQKSK